jgi:hypothetical protein
MNKDREIMSLSAFFEKRSVNGIQKNKIIENVVKRQEKRERRREKWKKDK